jgi:hypothetical protein
MVCSAILFSYSNNVEESRIDEFIGKTLQLLANRLTDYLEENSFSQRGFRIYSDKHEHLDWTSSGYMRKDLAGLLRRLPIYIRKLIKIKEENAYDYGCNMLQRFVSGEITGEELNEFSIKK